MDVVLCLLSLASAISSFVGNSDNRVYGQPIDYFKPADALAVCLLYYGTKVIFWIYYACAGRKAAALQKVYRARVGALIMLSVYYAASTIAMFIVVPKHYNTEMRYCATYISDEAFYQYKTTTMDCNSMRSVYDKMLCMSKGASYADKYEASHGVITPHICSAISLGGRLISLAIFIPFTIYFTSVIKCAYERCLRLETAMGVEAQNPS